MDTCHVRDGTDQHAEAYHWIESIAPGTHFARVHAHNWCGTSEASAAVAFSVAVERSVTDAGAAVSRAAGDRNEFPLISI